MSQHIYQTLSNLIHTHRTRDPYELLDALHVTVRETDRYETLKGYCYFCKNRIFIILNANLDAATKRIVAAHELGHLVLHRPEMLSSALFDASLCSTDTKQEYEANLFAADLLLTDEDILSHLDDATPDVFSMARALGTKPELLNLKMLSMSKRGYDIRVPLAINSAFLIN